MTLSRKLHLAVLGIAATTSLLFVPAASASILGVLDVANCPGGGVTVSLSTVDWTLPVGGGDGCVQANVGLTYGIPSSPTVYGGGNGTILDLPGGPAGFMTFVDSATSDVLTFDLGGIGPGVSNTVCSTVLNPNGPSCSVFAGSAFILAPTATGTSVTLSAFGTAHDSITPTDPGNVWRGAFTTQVAGLTPAAIQSIVVGGGSVHSTFSGEFIVTIPEPVPTALIGCGLILFASLRRRVRS